MAWAYATRVSRLHATDCIYSGQNTQLQVGGSDC